MMTTSQTDDILRALRAEWLALPRGSSERVALTHIMADIYADLGHDDFAAGLREDAATI